MAKDGIKSGRWLKMGLEMDDEKSYFIKKTCGWKHRTENLRQGYYVLLLEYGTAWDLELEMEDGRGWDLKIKEGRQWGLEMGDSREWAIEMENCRAGINWKMVVERNLQKEDVRGGGPEMVEDEI